MPRTGRPRGFDRDEALTTAMHLFWQHGFEAVSLDQLRGGMGGISSASFYAAFGSKEALYREALARYLASHGSVMAALHDRTLAPRARVETALRGSAVMQTDAGHPAGCMVILSAIIGPDTGTAVQALTARERAGNRVAIRACVDEAIAVGDLRATTDASGLATLLDGVLVGLSIQARDGVDGRTIDAAVSQSMKLWDANGAAHSGDRAE